MRLVEFLILLLEAQAQTLQRLAALFGEDVLVEMLETIGESFEATPPLRIHPAWFTRGSGGGSPYAELESSVHEMKLPAMLEFHLWAYPHYRSYIESELELDSKIVGPGGEAGITLVDEAVIQAEDWIKHLPLPPALGPQAERAAHVPWLRFRTSVLKRIGKRPLGPVY